MVRDVTAGIALHTSMRSELRDGLWQFAASDAERRRIHSLEMAKFHHLRQKFQLSLAKGNRIFVVKRNEGLTEVQAEELFNAIAAHGNGRLLFVTEADTGHKQGSVELLDTHVAHGRIDRFAPYSEADNVSLPCWETLLRATVALFHGQPTTRVPSPSFGSNPRRRELSRASRPFPLTISGAEQSRRDLASRGSIAEESVEQVVPAAGRRTRSPAARVSAPNFDFITLTRTGNKSDELDLDKIPVLQECNARRSFSSEFFDDRYYSAAYPAAVATRQIDTPVIGEYFSLSRRAIGKRLKSVSADYYSVSESNPEQIEVLRRMFAPSFYAQLIGVSYKIEALWEHYRNYGLPAGVPPTPLFDPVHYRRQVIERGLPPLRLGEPLVLHWVRIGLGAGVVPTLAFDELFYRATQPDLAKTSISPFMHYVSHGLYEGRSPSVWFDQDWYRDRNGATDDRYDQFIATGLHEGRIPSALVEEILLTFGRNIAFTGEIYVALLEASFTWRGQVSPRAIRILAHLYVPQWHPLVASPLKGFLSYLREGMSGGLPPGPMFDEAVYRRQAALAGLPAIEPGDDALVHWMRFGVPARVVPTERFDEAFYRLKNPDIVSSDVWGFEHFICHGVREGRVVTATPMYRGRAALPGMDPRPMPDFYCYWHAVDFPDRLNAGGGAIPAAAYQRLEQFLRSDSLADIFTKAQAIDPQVGEIDSITDFLLPPFHDTMALLHAAVRNRLPKAHYDSIICVPWIRVGGADLVAALLAKALLRIRPHERVLVLRTDQPDFERANWLPNEVDVVDISDLTATVPTNHAEDVLRDVCRGVTAHRMFNVNSRLCWTMLCTYGANLAATLRTYAYLFCWDLTPSGLRAGYPAEFYAQTANDVTAFLTDTQYLKNELSAMYRLPAPMRDRIVPMFTPAQTPVRTPSIARLVQDQGDPRSSRLVLWAGRLDRQKRFDLVQAIAWLMPDVEFRCWGAALLDAPPDLTNLPSNIRMQGGFGSFDDLPLTEAGAWLFTALWEGMPTTIIELATRGVAIVASAVGGVPELIRPDTGWPVPGDADSMVYASTLRIALNSPEEATRRAEALQHHVASIHNEVLYDTALAQLLAAEDKL